MIAPFLLLILGGCAVAGLVIYAIQNSGPISVTFVSLHWTGVTAWFPVVAAAAAILVALGIYVLVAGAGWRLRHGHLRRVAAEHDARAERLDQENLTMREELAGRRARGEPETEAPVVPHEHTGRVDRTSDTEHTERTDR